MPAEFSVPSPKTSKSNSGNAKARAFLAAYRKCGDITRAAAAVPIERTLHYRWLKQSDAYAEAFEAAKKEWGDVLEGEAIRRAVEGEFEPTVYQGDFTYALVKNPQTGKVEKSEIPVGLMKKSDTLLLALLKAAKPEKYAQRLSAEVGGPNGGPIPITDPALAALNDEELARLVAIASKLTSSRGNSGGAAPAATQAD